MTALTAARNTPLRENEKIEEHPVKGGVTIHKGALVCLDAAGWAIPGRVGTGLTSLGRAEDRASAVSDGSATVRIRRGVLRFDNSQLTDLVTRAAIGKAAYVVDDQTVALTDGLGTRSVAGIVRDVEAAGVWLKF